MKENYLITTPAENNSIEIHSNISSNDSDKKNNINIAVVCYKLIIGELIAIFCVGAGEFSNKISDNKHRHYSIILNFTYYLFFGIFWILFNHGMQKPKFYFFLIIFFDTQTNFFKFLSIAECDPSYLYLINTLSILFRVLLTYIFINKHARECDEIKG